MAKSQNSKFKCFSGILRCLLCISSLPTQPSDNPTDILTTTTTTTFENPKRNFKTQVKTPGVVARLMGLDSLPDPGKVFRRKEDQKEKVEFLCFYVYISKCSFCVYITKCMFVTVHADGRPPNGIARLMGLDGLPPQQPLHRQHKGYSEIYRQWTASVSSQRDGKPYEHRSNWKDSIAQEEYNDEYEVLETSKVERSSYPVKRTINSKLSETEMAFIQQKFMADRGWLLAQLIFLVDHRIPSSSFSGILRCLLCIGSLPTQPSDPTTDIPTPTTTVENPKKNFKIQAKTPGLIARLMGLDSLLDPAKVHIDGRPPNVIARLMVLDGLPPKQPLHRQRKGFSETYRQWTASISSQKDGKPYEH
ncbi:unnamed protein product [Camellia sinensis]